MIVTQHNAWIHVVATLSVIAMGVALRIGWLGSGMLVVAVVMVWIAEGVNTAIEKLCDEVHPEQSPGIGEAKDIAAGVVLLAAIGAVMIGLCVLGPPLWMLLFASS